MASGPVGKCVGGSDHVTFNVRAARIAAHSVSATTPTKLPFWTTWTIPGMPLIEDSSIETGFELTTGGRTTRPWSIPVTRTSCEYRNCPVNFGGRSNRATEVPTTL